MKTKFTFTSQLGIGDVIEVKKETHGMKPGLYVVYSVSAWTDETEKFPSSHIQYFLEGLTDDCRDYDLDDEIFLQEVKEESILEREDVIVDLYDVLCIDKKTNEQFNDCVIVKKDEFDGMYHTDRLSYLATRVEKPLEYNSCGIKKHEIEVLSYYKRS